MSLAWEPTDPVLERDIEWEGKFLSVTNYRTMQWYRIDEIIKLFSRDDAPSDDVDHLSIANCLCMSLKQVTASFVVAVCLLLC